MSFSTKMVETGGDHAWPSKYRFCSYEENKELKHMNIRKYKDREKEKQSNQTVSNFSKELWPLSQWGTEHWW